MVVRPPLRYEPPMLRFRFMFEDGSICDVEAARDDSVLRGWVRQQLFGTGKAEKDGPAIVGVATLPPEEETATEPSEIQYDPGSVERL